MLTASANSGQHRPVVTNSKGTMTGVGVREFEMGDRIVSLDTAYPSSRRGLLKAVQMMLSLLALILTAGSYGVEYERPFAMSVTFVGMLIAFAFLLINTLMLNHTVQMVPWAVTELLFYGVMVILYFLAGILIAVITANYWAYNNPRWQLVPALAAGTLFVCMILFGIDLALQLRSWKRYSWQPNRNHGPKPADSNSTVTRPLSPRPPPPPPPPTNREQRQELSVDN